MTAIVNEYGAVKIQRAFNICLHKSFKFGARNSVQCQVSIIPREVDCKYSRIQV